MVVLTPRKPESRQELDLQEKRNYHLFLVCDGLLAGMDGVLDIHSRHHEKKRFSSDPEDLECLEVPFRRWSIMTFYKTTALLKVRLSSSADKPTKYGIVLASVGATESEGPKRALDTAGNVYEIHEGTIYRNGKKHYQKRGEVIRSLCVTPNGKLYAMSEKKDVFSSDHGVVFRAKEKRYAVKMVSGKDNKVYILASDGTISTGEYLVYKRKDDKRAVDLFEENGQVWAITHEGERISLVTN